MTIGSGRKWRWSLPLLLLAACVQATASAEELRGTVDAVDGSRLRISVARPEGIRVGDRVTVGTDIPGLGFVPSPAEWRVRRIEGGVVHAETERAPATLPRPGYRATVHTAATAAATAGMTLDRARLPPVAREGWIGVIVQEVRKQEFRPGAAQAVEVPGIRLAVVFDDQPAARAGLREDDVVTRIDGQSPAGAAGEFFFERLERSVGRAIAVDYERAGQAHSTRVTVEPMPLDHPFVQGRIGAAYRNGKGVPADPALGFAWMLKAAEGGDAFAMLAVAQSYRSGGEGQARDPDAAWRWVERAAAQGEGTAKGLLVLRRAGVDPFDPPPRKNLGVVFSVRKGSMSSLRVDPQPAPPVVDEVAPGSAAARAGVQRGDIVASLNGIAVTHFVELLEALRTVPLHQPVPLVVLRGGRETRLTVRFDSVFEPPPK